MILPKLVKKVVIDIRKLNDKGEFYAECGGQPMGISGSLDIVVREVWGCFPTALLRNEE